jgi:Fe(3+) dicitrate transport protein
VNVRDNIANARFVGVEIFEEIDLLKLFRNEASWALSWYNNLAWVEARYQQAEVSAVDEKRVEHVPRMNFKTGVQCKKDRFAGGVQLNHVSDQFTDATNAVFFPDATVGLIPAYTVLDLSLSYEWQWLRLEGSVNNFTDRVYFTRRATGYPGPGIIPAERRMFFMTLQVKI